MRGLCFWVLLTIHLTFTNGKSVHKITRIYKTEEFYYDDSEKISNSNEILEEYTKDGHDISIAQIKLLPLCSPQRFNPSSNGKLGSVKIRKNNSSKNSPNNLKFSAKEQTIDDLKPETEWTKKENKPPIKSPNFTLNSDDEISEFVKAQTLKDKYQNYKNTNNSREISPKHYEDINGDIKPTVTTNFQRDNETNLQNQTLDEPSKHPNRYYLKSRTGHNQNNATTTLPYNKSSNEIQLNMEDDSYDNIIHDLREIDHQRDSELQSNLASKVEGRNRKKKKQEISTRNERKESATKANRMKDNSQTKLDSSQEFFIKPTMVSDNVNPNLITTTTQQDLSPSHEYESTIPEYEYTDDDWRKLINLLHFIQTKQLLDGKGHSHHIINQIKNETLKELRYVNDRRDIYEQPTFMAESMGNPVNKPLQMTPSNTELYFYNKGPKSEFINTIPLKAKLNENNEVMTMPLREKQEIGLIDLYDVSNNSQNESGPKNPIASEEKYKYKNEVVANPNQYHKDNTTEIVNMSIITNKIHNSGLMIPIQFDDEDPNGYDVEDIEGLKQSDDIPSDIKKLYSLTKLRIPPGPKKPILAVEKNSNTNSKEDIEPALNQDKIGGITITTHKTGSSNSLPPYEENILNDTVEDMKSGQLQEDNASVILNLPTETMKTQISIYKNILSVKEKIAYNGSNNIKTLQPNEENVSAISTSNFKTKLRIFDPPINSRIQSEKTVDENTKEYIEPLPSEHNTSRVTIKTQNTGSKNHIPSDDEDASGFRLEESKGKGYSQIKLQILGLEKTKLRDETNSNESTTVNRNNINKIFIKNITDKSVPKKLVQYYEENEQMHNLSPKNPTQSVKDENIYSWIEYTKPVQRNENSGSEITNINKPGLEISIPYDGEDISDNKVEDMNPFQSNDIENGNSRSTTKKTHNTVHKSTLPDEQVTSNNGVVNMKTGQPNITNPFTIQPLAKIDDTANSDRKLQEYNTQMKEKPSNISHVPYLPIKTETIRHQLSSNRSNKSDDTISDGYVNKAHRSILTSKTMLLSPFTLANDVSDQVLAKRKNNATPNLEQNTYAKGPNYLSRSETNIGKLSMRQLQPNITYETINVTNRNNIPTIEFNIEQNDNQSDLICPSSTNICNNANNNNADTVNKFISTPYTTGNTQSQNTSNHSESMGEITFNKRVETPSENHTTQINFSANISISPSNVTAQIPRNFFKILKQKLISLVTSNIDADMQQNTINVS